MKRVRKVRESVILGLDPGPETSGVVVVTNTYPPRVKGAWAALPIDKISIPPDASHVIIEWLSSYGTIVGDDTFMTALHAGMIKERAEKQGIQAHLLKRPDAAHELTGHRGAKDKQTKAAIREIYHDANMLTGGGSDKSKGTKKQPGPLYGVSSHSWDALAVIIAWLRITYGY
jgi:hypothetical protein